MHSILVCNPFGDHQLYHIRDIESRSGEHRAHLVNTRIEINHNVYASHENLEIVLMEDLYHYSVKSTTYFCRNKYNDDPFKVFAMCMSKLVLQDL